MSQLPDIDPTPIPIGEAIEIGSPFVRCARVHFNLACVTKIKRSDKSVTVFTSDGLHEVIPNGEATELLLAISPGEFVQGDQSTDEPTSKRPKKSKG